MKVDFLSQQLIISTPSVDDELFQHSVVLLFKHNEAGAFGLIINKPTEHQLGEVLLDLKLNADCLGSKEPIYQGGPLGVDRGFILHSSGMRWPSTVKVTEQVFLTTSNDILEDISKDLGPTEYLVALGYSSWGPGQLEEELKDNAWLVVQPNRKLIFGDPGTRYARAAGQIGINIDLVTQQKGVQ
ncbi:MAG: YqgE/AlgH family protein [Gammaproteobacteria bacterium]|nr:YqgE/AlgH family protein [Gammaproteobacteria bacterium]